MVLGGNAIEFRHFIVLGGKLYRGLNGLIWPFVGVVLYGIMGVSVILKVIRGHVFIVR